MTKLSRFCDGVLEAGWLAALVLAPLFFNTFSDRVFEPDKISLVRSIALVMLAAWGAKAFDAQRGGLSLPFRPDVRRWSRWPLAVPVAGLLSTYLLSTLFSVTPHASLWGSYARLQGTYTLLAYLVIFAAIAAHMRRREQVERLITMVILTSLPVSLYGVMQRLKVDPLPWGEDTTQRVTSTMGNAIFIGSYLIMALPLTAMRMLQSFRAVLREEAGLPRNLARATVYVFALAMQLLALWFSGSRGPWLGAAAGLFCWALLLTVVFKRRRATVAILGVAALAAAFLIALNIPNGPLQPLRDTQALGRLGRVFEVQDDTSKVRLLIWRGAVKLALPHGPLVYPDNRPDAFNVIRPLIGYGPESMYVAFNRFYEPEIAHYERRNATPDRAHNETFDALATTGALGLAAYLVLFAAVIFYGLVWIGAVTEADRWTFAAFYAGGGVAGAAALVAWRGPEYFGVGLPFGILLGVLAFVAWLAVTRHPAAAHEQGDCATDEWTGWIVAALLGGIVAHFTEIHFGIGVVSSRTHFWAYAGVLIAVGWAMRSHGEEHTASPQTAGPPPTPRKRQTGRAAESAPQPNRLARLSPAIFIGLVLTTMTYDFITNPAKTSSVVEMLRASLTTLFGSTGATSYWMLAMFAAVWLAAIVLWCDDLRGAALTWAGSAGVWLMFTLPYLQRLGAVATRQPANVDELVQTVTLLAGAYGMFALWVMMMLALGALALATEWPTRAACAAWRGAGRAALAAAGVALALAAGYLTNTRPVQANVMYKIAGPLDAQGRLSTAIPLYQQAVRLAPLEDQYHLFLGRAYLQVIGQIADASRWPEMLKLGHDELLIAERLNPLNPDHAANLARLDEQWAAKAADATQAGQKLAEADAYYATAVSLSPNAVGLWNEWARLQFGLRGDMTGGLQKLETSLKLDDTYSDTYAAFGDYWSKAAQAATDAATQQADYTKAVDYYGQAITAEAARAGTPKSVAVRVGLGSAQKALGHWEASIAAYEEVVTLTGEGYNLWAVYNALADAYLGKGDKATARGYAQKALDAAPDADSKAAAQATLDRIGK
ncbi:MAG: O-antigen ligase family protein [Chloroflexi bacterium]|nr:O-antigen ligase family protein [Chloroflexota bacterium]